MAISARLSRTPWEQGASPAASWAVAWGIRSLLVLYVAIIVTVHIATLPEIFQLTATACEPGACLPGQLNQTTLDDLATRGISASLYAGVMTLLVLLIPVIGTTLAGITIWQRPTAWVPMLFVISIANCTIHASGAWTILTWRLPWLADVELLIGLPMLLMWPVMSAIFPDGRFVPRCSIAFLAVPAFELLVALRPSLETSLPGWLMTANGWAWIVIATICIPWRLHVTSDSRSRRQVKIWGLALLPMLLFSAATTLVDAELFDQILAGGYIALLGQVMWAISILWLLTGFMLAIYLYQLYDLTVVARRSLIYGMLTVSLIALYLLIAGTLSVTLRGDNSVLTGLLATAAIALAFAPLRDWLQQLVRRMLYGDQQDPYGVLSRFGAELERETVPDRLLRSIVDLAQDSLRVPGVELSVGGVSRIEVRAGAVGTRPMAVPVRYQGDELGTLVVARRSPNERFSPADRRLIDEIARQIGIAVHSVQQAETLRHSRERIVTAREEERRRLRRDLHDGLGPSLAALSLQVEIARDLIATDPHRSSELLDDVLGQTRESILDIRRLVYELRPPALDDLGLIGAIRAQAMTWERSGLYVTLELPEVFNVGSAATEVAIYRIVQEAMTNVLRHAQATTARISLTVDANSVRIEIEDDGRGLPESPQPGVGLISMGERAAELGGSCEAIAIPTGGTRIVASFRTQEHRDD